MGSSSTNNSLQTATLYQLAGGESGSGTSQSGSSPSDVPTTASQTVQVVSGREGEISPALAALMAQSVQAALTAKRAARSSPSVSTPPRNDTSALVVAPSSSVSVPMATSYIGGVPSSLFSSASNFLAAGTGIL